jgi:hypothetical protein
VRFAFAVIVGVVAIAAPLVHGNSNSFSAALIPKGHGWWCTEGGSVHSPCSRAQRDCTALAADLRSVSPYSLACVARPSIWCFTYRRGHSDRFECSALEASCQSFRQNVIDDGTARIRASVSACVAVY